MALIGWMSSGAQVGPRRGAGGFTAAGLCVAGAPENVIRVSHAARSVVTGGGGAAGSALTKRGDRVGSARSRHPAVSGQVAMAASFKRQLFQGGGAQTDSSAVC
ncbi:hypothetical protein EYF80_041328 [Liparis tanakae]|uniref:Uncharacterized protein n=1 Tax=Liparis tanakae TaxID=230148 RepID=A0A4Z2G6P3_9TELE|nr:hypothetical protein EYF80_041328 [Liparis tanakae]